MRKLKDVSLRTIPLSDVESLRAQGFVPLQAGDASMANSDYFMVMVKQPADEDKDRGVHVEVLCPSFLRGGLGMRRVHGFSY